MPDFTDESDQITPHFKVKDALFLHNWNRLATEDDGADFAKLTVLCQKMEEIRTLLGCPINVHNMFRSQKYNQEQGIKPDDAHSQNVACDFDCNETMSIADVQAKLLPELENLGIRMENNTATWTHIDLREPGPSGRHFTA